MKFHYIFAYLIIEISFCLEPFEDKNTNYIIFSNKEIKISEGSAYTKDKSVVIENPGSFIVTGESKEGNIEINSSSVTLFLLDLYLSSKNNAPIIVKSNLNDVRIINLKNSTLNDLEKKSTTEGECAVIKIKKNSNVSFKNQDILELNGRCKDVIKGGSNTKITFENSDGEYIINGKKTAIDSDGSIEFNGGIFTIESEKGDAIKSSPDDSDTDSLGKITVNDGIFYIHSFNDGITAKNIMTIKKGRFEIKTENGHDSETYNETESSKGFKLTNNDTGCGIYIYGGEFYFNTADDAIRSNGDLTIFAGKIEIYTKDDGLCSKKNLVLGRRNAPNEDLQINIEKSYEAIEGVTITINSGIIISRAKNDGINASGNQQEERDRERKMMEERRNRTRNNNTERNNTDRNNRDRNSTDRNNTDRNSNRTWPWNNGNYSNFNWTWPNGNGNGTNRTNPWGNGNYTRNNTGRGFNWGNYDWEEVRRTHVNDIPVDRYKIRIFGGELYVYTNSDGIDSNGHIYIHGGNINVYSDGTGANMPIDTSGNFSLFNAEVLNIGAGGVEFVHVALKTGNQMYAFHDGLIKKNQKLEIRDENDKFVKEGYITKDINYIFYTSLKLNENYHFYIIDEDNNETELEFEFGSPENGLDDQDDYVDKNEKNDLEEKREKEESNEDSSNYLKMAAIGIYLLLL